MTGIRCFVAVDLPASMHADIEGIQRGIATNGLRLVRPELVHVTLKFLGDVPEESIDKVAEALRAVKVAPFTAQVKGVGAFPGRSIRVVWLGLEGNFEELYRKVEDALSPLGFEREARGFSPHVTLGRVGRPSSETTCMLSPKIAALAGTDLGSFTVDKFLLKKSTLTRGGPIYEDIAKFPLRDPG
ncbi:MAG TPA: RNA 2',3'-cyclic phosphodiesterase [Methanotrichaceae archaeon]|nr:RNA 2',3'-cyclic phosphodiesterase [Methanotrichaceae archaeon]